MENNLSYPNQSFAIGCQGPLSDGNKAGLTLAYVFVLISAIIGNTFVIYIVRTKKKMKVSFNFLVVNMAVADTLNALSSMPLSISYLYNANVWFGGVFGEILCRGINFLVVVSILISLATLTAITVERYLATTKVLKRPLSIKSVKRLIAFIWIVASVSSVHELLKMEVRQGPDGFNYCVMSPIWAERFITEFIIKFVVSYAIPLLTMVILYSMIICLLWKKQAIGEEIDEYNRRLHKQKKGVIIKLVTIMTIFAACWLPVHVIHLIASFDYNLYACVPLWVTLLMYWLAHANSAINPFLYLMLTKNSRALFKAHISGIIRGDGSSGSKNRDKGKHDSIMFWRRSGSKKTTKSFLI